jgi:hypothetical protein
VQPSLVGLNAELNALEWDPPLARGGATLSQDGRYRYRLWRTFGTGGTLCFVMLNPSTADASADDPTIRKCLGFARRLGFGGIDVVNLFAWRATDPGDLPHVTEPIGAENDDWIVDRCKAADLVVAAWGATKLPNRMVERRACEVRRLLSSAGVTLQCLGCSQEGAPRHPLMLAYATPLQDYRA